jgi:hypothetical protein
MRNTLLLDTGLGFGPDLYDPASGSYGGGGGGGTYSTPQYNPNVITTQQQSGGGSSGGNWNWSQFSNNVAGIISQLIARGGNPTNQVLPGGVGALPNPQVQMTQAQAAAAISQSQWGGGTRNADGSYYNPQGGGALEQAFGGLTQFVSQNPLLVFGGIAALFLLYRQPPSGKR